MGDVAQILGITASSTFEATKPNVPLSKSKTSQLLPQQAIDAITFTKGSDYDSANLPPIVPDVVRVNNKLILSQKKARPWCWAPFASNARNDGLLLHHWVRAGVEYPEYPFARFNIHLDPLSFDDVEDTDEFYKEHLHNDNWTQSETETLLELCKSFELRWPVIADRWLGKFGRLSNKRVEDLQHRYYTIGMVLNRRVVQKAAKVESENLAKALTSTNENGGLAAPNSIQSTFNKNTLPAEHALATAIADSSSSDVTTLVGNVTSSIQPLIMSTNTGTTNQPTFDLETERQRRKIIDLIWERTKEEELEEEALREELKLVETQLRKLKKSGGYLIGSNHPLPSRGPSPTPTSGTDVRTIMEMNSSHGMLDSHFSSIAPTPTSGIPYLQSGRLVQPSTAGHLGISKATLKRMEQVLNELSVKERPLPTNRVCDMYDHVRKGVLTLLALQKIMLKRESEVVSKRLKLEKVAGATALKAVEAALAAENAKKEKEAAAEKRSKSPSKGGSSKAKSEVGEVKKKTTNKTAPSGDKSDGDSKKRKAPSKKTTDKNVSKVNKVSSNAPSETSSPGNKKAKTST